MALHSKWSEFYFVKPLDPRENSSAEIANSLFGYLRENNILVRYFPKHPLTSSFTKCQYWQAI